MVETPEKDKEIRCLVGLLDHQEKVVSEKDAQLRKLRDRVSTLESQRAAMASRARLLETSHFSVSSLSCATSIHEKKSPNRTERLVLSIGFSV